MNKKKVKKTKSENVMQNNQTEEKIEKNITNTLDEMFLHELSDRVDNTESIQIDESTCINVQNIYHKLYIPHIIYNITIDSLPNNIDHINNDFNYSIFTNKDASFDTEAEQRYKLIPKNIILDIIEKKKKEYKKYCEKNNINYESIEKYVNNFIDNLKNNPNSEIPRFYNSRVCNEYNIHKFKSGILDSLIDGKSKISDVIELKYPLSSLDIIQSVFWRGCMINDKTTQSKKNNMSHSIKASKLLVYLSKYEENYQIGVITNNNTNQKSCNYKSNYVSNPIFSMQRDLNLSDYFYNLRHMLNNENGQKLLLKLLQILKLDRNDTEDSLIKLCDMIYPVNKNQNQKYVFNAQRCLSIEIQKMRDSLIRGIVFRAGSSISGLKIIYENVSLDITETM